MTKFLLFAGYYDIHTSSMNNFVGQFNSVIDAINYFQEKQLDSNFDWYEIVNKETMKIVKKENLYK